VWQNRWFSARRESGNIKSKHKWVTLLHLCTKCRPIVGSTGSDGPGRPAAPTDSDDFVSWSGPHPPPPGSDPCCSLGISYVEMTKRRLTGGLILWVLCPIMNLPCSTITQAVIAFHHQLSVPCRLGIAPLFIPRGFWSRHRKNNNRPGGWS
jgi:hypothetical protein